MTTARESVWQRLRWPLLSVALTVLLAVGRVAVNPRFYFADDTERGSFGQWWALGEYLTQGALPVLDPSAWQGGNYFAEGQWGILSPVTWLIGLTAYLAPDAAVHVTAWKVLFLAGFTIGMYLIARDFGASRPWAALAGVLAPAAGFTVYMDAASWSTGLFDACLLPLVWWTLRRAVEGGRSPVPYVIVSFTLITFGYVFGVIVLVVLLVESLVRHLVRRDRIRIVRTLAASAWGALWTIVIYLPAVMTSSVTVRGESPYENTGFLNADVADLFSVGSPLSTASIHAWDGAVEAPLVYIAWLLPLIPLFLPISAAAARRLIPLWIYGGAMLLFVIAPSDLGAIRWPIRMMPYLAIAAILVLVVAASESFPARITRRRAWTAFGVVGAAAYISYVGEMWSWKSIIAGAVLQLLALAALVLLARRDRALVRAAESAPARAGAGGSSSVRQESAIASGAGSGAAGAAGSASAGGSQAARSARLTALAVLAAMLVTMGVGAAQLIQWRSSPLPSVNAPTETDELEAVMSGVEGDAILVGDYMKGARTPASWDERLMANLWYLSDAEVSSVYTVLPFTAYATDLCADLRGLTCADALDVLWSTDDDTGVEVASLLSVSAIVAAKHTYPVEPEAPAGWHLADEGEWNWFFERDEALPSAGGVTWTGEGTNVSVTDQSQTTATFTVDAVGADPRVVLSRLPFPGYGVDGAAFADPVRGYLLTVDLSSAQPGDEVTVRFLPPPFPVLAASFVLAWLVLAAWLIARAVARRRGASPRG